MKEMLQTPNQETKISNSFTLHFQEVEKQEQINPKVSRKKVITKIRAEINEIETKKTIKKRSMKLRSGF